VYGSKSEVTFKKGDVELATVSYNAQVEKEDDEPESAIEDTRTFTTIQRPDIVLRLSKKSERDIVYTYLFDAKYRLNDRRIEGKDVPPEDAINQMHRYRDAIYYADGKSNEQLKKEIIGGYVLYPGNMGKTEYEQSYYHRSIEKVGIGAFPLRPGTTRIDEEGNLYIDPTSSEIVLYEQIRTWLEESDRKAGLLEKVIPQKGLQYTSEESKESVYMILTIDKDVNDDTLSVITGQVSSIVMGKMGMEEAKDIQSVRYIAPIIPGGHIEGYYKVTKANLKRVEDTDYPIRIKFDVADWTKLEIPAKFGMVRAAYRGFCYTRNEFFKHCKEQKIY
jgi:hypothetical protein